MTAVSTTLIGNLTHDPELRFTPSGKAVVNFTIATSKSYKDEGGKWQDKDTTFWRCTAWDKVAENIAESLMKGDSVIAQAELAERTWENKDGSKGSRVEATVWNIGPDLRRFPAKVARTERKAPLSASQDDPWAAPPALEEPPF